MKIYFEKIKWAWIWVLGTLKGPKMVRKNGLLRKKKSEHYIFG